MAGQLVLNQTLNLMSDTTILGKTVSGKTKAIALYIAIDIAFTVLIGIGQAMFDLKQEDWASWWTMKKAGWWMLQVGAVISSAGLLLKATTSNSTK